MGFMLVDIFSMVTFTLCVKCLTIVWVWRTGVAFCAVGWLVTAAFAYYFSTGGFHTKPIPFLVVFTRHEELNHLDDHLRWAARMSVIVDVGGKFFMYVLVALYAEDDELRMPPFLKIFEFLTTLAEAVLKWAHASHARAYENTSNTSKHDCLLPCEGDDSAQDWSVHCRASQGEKT